ncbi:protoporphyrinogen oxidase [Gordonia sputi]
MTIDVAVVGAGISGLTAAFRLRQRLGPDARIDLYEAGERTGGILKTVDVGADGRGSVLVDVGAEAFIVRRPEALGLVTELGLADRVVSPTGRRPALWACGRLHDMPRPALMGIPATPDAVAGLVDPADLERMRAEPDRPLEWAPGTDVSVGDLVAHRFGPSVVSRSVDPMLGGVYSSLAADIGVREALPALAAQLDAGAPSLTAAVGALLANPTTTGPVFGTLIGGYRVLVEALLDAARPDLRTCAAVTDVRRNGSRWALFTGDRPAATDASYDGVVLSTPCWMTGHMLRREAPDAASTLLAVERARSVVVSITLAPDTALPDNSGVLVATGEDLRAKAFTLSSRKWAHLGEPGELLSVRASFGRYRQSIPDEDVEPGIDDRLRDWALADLDRVCAAAGIEPLTGRVIDTFVQRWELPRYAPGHLATMARVEASLPAGLALAGNAVRGVGVPACIGQAGRAVERLLGDLEP